MKIGTLLTSAIVSLSTVGGGLAVYVAVTKYQTMERISEAQGRLAIVRAVSDIPRYLNPERGFSTNILYGPATIDPALLAEQEKLRKQTDGARDRMNALRKELPGSFDDGTTIGSNIDGINTKFTALREAIDKALAGPAEARKDAAKKTQEGPEVDPTKFIAACQQLIADFGNIDDNGEPLMVRINAIAAIAETVATELYGDVTSAREQQDLMWNEATTSVFDLEAAELAAEQKGETMPWHNDAYDGKLPDGFTADQAGQYIKKVGGG